MTALPPGSTGCCGHRMSVATACLPGGPALGQYNSTTAAEDIADYLAVSGIDSVNVYGASYGTRIAFSLLRDHPQRVRSMVLESVLPPDADLVLAAANRLWRGHHPDFRELRCRSGLPPEVSGFGGTIPRAAGPRLNRIPVEIEIYNPEDTSAGALCSIGRRSRRCDFRPALRIGVAPLHADAARRFQPRRCGSAAELVSGISPEEYRAGYHQRGRVLRLRLRRAGPVYRHPDGRV